MNSTQEMEIVTKAVQEARFNEVVVINISDCDDTPREIILTATIDETNGGISWQEAADDSNGEDIGIIRHLRTKRWVLPMLNDNDRNQLYNKAIQRASHQLVQQHEENPGANIKVLDIGSGTGLLAMMAAKHIQDELQRKQIHSIGVNVTSLEMASAMARLARKTIASNSFDNIEVLEQHSCEYSGSQFHFCTSELLESGLLGEGIIPALRDAWARHLSKDAIMIPQQARVYVQILESSERIERYRGPKPVFELQGGSSRSPFRMTRSDKETDTLCSSDKGVIVPIHAAALFDGDNPARALSDKMEVMDFDFTSPDRIPCPTGRSRTTSITPILSGHAHGLLFWWELDLWEDCMYSTEPGKQEWQDHWQQCLYIFPSQDTNCEHVTVGEAFDLVCYHTDNRLDFSIGMTEQNSKRYCRVNNSSALLSPERTFQLNDEKRIQSLREAIQHALLAKGRDVPVIDISDFSLCAVLSALDIHGGLSVTSVESSTGQIPIMAAEVAQLGNGLPKSSNPLEHPTFQIVQTHIENISSELLGGRTAEIVVGEPYYELLEGWHLQEAMNYFYIMRLLKKRNVVAEDACSVPSFAIIKACAIECIDIAHAYSNCGDEKQHVCGFNHAIVNKYRACHCRHSIVFPMWQYAHKYLTEPFEVARLNYEGNVKTNDSNGWNVADFTTFGCCHGVMIWVEYALQAEGKITYISTNTRAHQQLVCLLEVAKEVSSSSQSRFHLALTLGGLPNNEDHQIDMKIEP